MENVMKIIVIGATGTIGKHVVNLLEKEHNIVKVGHRGGDYQIDIASKNSVEELFRQVGSFDALVSAAGLAKFGTLKELTDQDYMFGLTNKLMGQVNLVRIGRNHINEGGSFTLTSGVLSQEPMPGSASISMVNAALEGFVRASALEMDRGARVNIVSPVFAKETMAMMGMDDSGGMPAAQFAPSYKESVEGTRNGEVLDVREFS
jgi:NAD(P)-dependent dehydrogenase (short-subunit alcohol dehydrogenase family)